MRIEIRGRGITVSKTLREYVEHRLKLALDRFERHLSTARLRIDDINGPRGGVDKRCVIEVSGARLAPTFVEVTDRDLHAAIDRASEVAGRAVRSAIGRARVAAPMPRLRPVP